MKITTSGIDVAKSVFQIHGVDEHGKVALRRQLRRAQLLLFFSRFEPCLIGIRPCYPTFFVAALAFGGSPYTLLELILPPAP